MKTNLTTHLISIMFPIVWNAEKPHVTTEEKSHYMWGALFLVVDPCSIKYSPGKNNNIDTLNDFENFGWYSYVLENFANKMFLIAYDPYRTCRLYHQPYVWSFTQEFFLLNFEICELVSIRFRSQISITNHNLVGCFYKDRTRS